MQNRSELAPEFSGHGAYLPRSAAQFRGPELLAVLRHLLASMTDQEPLGWITALGIAERDFADCGGARVAAGLLAAIQRLHQVRPVAFRYQNPNCLFCSARISTDEARFLAALQSAATGPNDTSRRHLQVLTFSPDIEPLLAVLVQLAADLGLAETAQLPS
jgi:hypothetical protein